MSGKFLNSDLLLYTLSLTSQSIRLKITSLTDYLPNTPQTSLVITNKNKKRTKLFYYN